MGQDAIKVRKHSEMLDYLEHDGVYVDDPEVEAKFKMSFFKPNNNVIRLEERLLKANE